MWPFCAESRALRRLVKHRPELAHYFPIELEVVGGNLFAPYRARVKLSTWLGVWSTGGAAATRTPSDVELQTIMELVGAIDFFTLNPRYGPGKSNTGSERLTIGLTSVYVCGTPGDFDAADPQLNGVQRFFALWTAFELSFGVRWLAPTRRS